MNNEELNLAKEDFTLVGENRPMHDKELVTKPISYFHDAWNRFCRNKGSVVAAVIIAILVLYAIIAPIFSPYAVSYEDSYYSYVLPKSHLFANTNFWDGCTDKTLNERSFIYYYSMGLETGHTPIKNNAYTVEKIGADTRMYSFRLDTYQKVGCIFISNMSKEEYTAIQKYQDDYGVQVIYPVTSPSLRPTLTVDKTDANYWYKTEMKGVTTPVDYTVNDDGTFTLTNIYAPYNGKDGYTSRMRFEGEGVYTYNYSVLMQGEQYEVRVNYYEYYLYMHKMVYKDKITEPFFLFGTTARGQDIWTCLASGARFSFLFAIGVALVNMVVGAIYGALEGYYGGKVDMIMERIVEILSAVPMMIVITLLKYHFSNGSNAALLLFISFFLTGWIGMSGTVRMQFYRFKNQEYVLAARTLGAKDRRIMFKHIFPNALGTIVTSCVLVIPGMIFSETSLSYLHIINLDSGDMTSVGTLLAGGQPYLSTFPHIILFPSIFISLLMLSFNLFGNGLRDAFNPSLRGTEE